mmetsp:Transcript_26148/g.78168  ORF Transcript_26148/g.78168 Transcript_26148/m.78168 type:complete len:246 (-) Transcript_26148:1986-2723(-)
MRRSRRQRSRGSLGRRAVRAGGWRRAVRRSWTWPRSCEGTSWPSGCRKAPTRPVMPLPRLGAAVAEAVQPTLRGPTSAGCSGRPTPRSLSRTWSGAWPRRTSAPSPAAESSVNTWTSCRRGPSGRPRPSRVPRLPLKSRWCRSRPTLMTSWTSTPRLPAPIGEHSRLLVTPPAAAGVPASASSSPVSSRSISSRTRPWSSSRTGSSRTRRRRPRAARRPSSSEASGRSLVWTACWRRGRRPATPG